MGNCKLLDRGNQSRCPRFRNAKASSHLVCVWIMRSRNGLFRCVYLFSVPIADLPPPSTPVIPSSAIAVWPQVSGRVGSYTAESDQDIVDMDGDGLSMVLGGIRGESAAQAEAVRVANGVVEIDAFPQMIIYGYCQTNSNGTYTSCPISDSDQATILSEIKAHFASKAGDSNVVAYWILDDYPGADISALLQKVHDLLAEANNDPSSVFPRPAMCGIGAMVLPVTDTQFTPTDPYWKGFQRALTNFRPGYCDIVSLYAYAYNITTGPNDPTLYDWSMAYVLPEAFKELAALGWNPSTEPFVALPQAFGYDGYVTPTEADIVTQMTAYCKAGAVALLPYSWHDGFGQKNPGVPFTEPTNSAYMRAGLAEGLKQCQSYWPKGY
jgi:hypothetical protein